jgi:ribosomal protein L20
MTKRLKQTVENRYRENKIVKEQKGTAGRGDELLKLAHRFAGFAATGISTGA